MNPVKTVKQTHAGSVWFVQGSDMGALGSQVFEQFKHYTAVVDEL